MSTADPDVALRALRLLAGPDAGVPDTLAGLAAHAADDPRATESIELARAVAERLAERDRRERELTALYETAGDLSSRHDLEEVLQAIVTRARGLLGTEAAYLMLIDRQRGDTYVRVTDGIRTDAFKAARLDMGAGLGGLVAQTRRPYATPDYPGDRRFKHTVDAIVNAEGLIAVLGVPVLLREEVIGVLFAANRRQRPFADSEVALLISLATHAAIAIETASLFADVRAHSDLVERAGSVHERLTAVAAGGGRLPDLAAAVAEALDSAVVVADPALRALAAAGTSEEPAAITGGLATACRAALTTQATVITADGCATPVTAGTQPLAVLAARRGDLDNADQRTFERAALVVAILLLTQRQLAEAEQRVRGDLLTDLLADTQPDSDGLRRRARLLGIDLDTPHVVVVAEPVSGKDLRLAVSALTGWAGERGGLGGEHGRTVVLLVPAADPQSAAEHGGDRARCAGCAVTVTATGPAAGPAPIRDAHREARQCVDVLTALGRTGSVATPQDLGVFGILFGPSGRDRIQRFITATLAPVLEHDARRGTDLLGTMEAYFDADTSHARAAAALFIHPNTLYQRIERINGLLGDGWRSGDQALQNQLAIKLHRIDVHLDRAGR
ncbi:GAF domain-containing protein [Micromonospora sp. U56]|uniref:helix-turn-helix domain-containing protein n=1 Tax=Micromonospora sp. U56 TaxID=2824900 RepID=UPI001B390302|nr:GAF domain-containing protein [Micromonospora sp. U56]MBQ0893310.1 GAF domain-containing protein [Micromonospora sp. U56]